LNKSRPICIKKNAICQDCPSVDLYVSPNHGILINNRLVLAKNLVNNTTIYPDYTRNNVEYYHLELQKHSAIVANGILSESYLEFNNRHIFEKNVVCKNNICDNTSTLCILSQ